MHRKGVEGEQRCTGAQGRKKKYRLVSIINVVCKLCMMVLREIINGWVTRE